MKEKQSALPGCRSCLQLLTLMYDPLSINALPIYRCFIGLGRLAKAFPASSLVGGGIDWHHHAELRNYMQLRYTDFADLAASHLWC